MPELQWEMPRPPLDAHDCNSAIGVEPSVREYNVKKHLLSPH